MNQFKEAPDSYCSDIWIKVWTPYNSLDIYIVPLTCAFGCLTNILNMIVFTRKDMRNPTNFILTSLSFVNFLSLAATLFYRIFNSFRNELGIDSFFFAVLVQFGINRFLYHLFHSWSIFVTLLIALWRFLGILSPIKSRSWFTQRNAKLAVLFTITCSSLLIPFMFIQLAITKSLKMENCFEPRENSPQPQMENSEKTQDLIKNENSGIILNVTTASASALNQNMTTNFTVISTVEDETEENCQYFGYVINQGVLGSQLYLWIWGILIELVPCLLLTFLTVALILTLTKARRTRKNLRSCSVSNFSRGNQHKSKTSCSELPEINENEMEERLNQNQDKINTIQLDNESEDDSDSDSDNGNSNANVLTRKLNERENEKEDREFNRTTKILIAVLLLFLCSELPFAVFSVVNALILVWPKLQKFYFDCYSPIILFCDLNIYLGMSLNFFIYFKMSTRFRSAFRDYVLNFTC